MLVYRTQDDILHFIPPARQQQPGSILPPGVVQVGSGQVLTAPDSSASPAPTPTSTPAATSMGSTRPVVEGGESIEAPEEEPMPVAPLATETAEQRLARLKLERRAHLINAAAMLGGILAGFWMDRRS